MTLVDQSIVDDQCASSEARSSDLWHSVAKRIVKSRHHFTFPSSRSTSEFDSLQIQVVSVRSKDPFSPQKMLYADLWRGGGDLAIGPKKTRTEYKEIELISGRFHLAGYLARSREVGIWDGRTEQDFQRTMRRSRL